MRLWATYEDHDCGFDVFSRSLAPWELNRSQSVAVDVVSRKELSRCRKKYNNEEKVTRASRSRQARVASRLTLRKARDGDGFSSIMRLGVPSITSEGPPDVTVKVPKPNSRDSSPHPSSDPTFCRLYNRASALGTFFRPAFHGQSPDAFPVWG